MVHFLAVTIFPVLMIFAGAGDALSLRIPNKLVLVIIACFFPLALLTGMPLAQIGINIATGAGLLVIGFVLFELGLFGGGDAKLLAGAGLWLGWPDIVPFLVMTAFAGAILAIVIGIWSMFKMDSEVHNGMLFRHLGELKPNVPYGFAFAVGAVLAFPGTWWMPLAA